MKILILLAAISLTTAARLTSSVKEAHRVRYDGYAVHKIHFKTSDQRVAIEKLLESRTELNVWGSATNEMHIMMNPQQFAYFENVTRTIGISSEVWIPNVQSLIDEEQRSNRVADNNEFSWKRYNNLAEMYAWLDEMLAAFPTVAEGFILGKSYEGRDIRGIKISHKAGNPGVFIESNIHAREWITSATATWFIKELLTSQNTAVRDLAESIDWYIVPVLNVDGFVYTHETDRLWRKTRQPYEGTACIGADPNRNYDTHWMENGGASDNPCSNLYAGPKPFSEPEVRAMEEFFKVNRDKINILLAFHSYSQLLLSPYGHTVEEKPENYDDLMAVGGAYADAVFQLPYKTDYEVGGSAEILYVASGATNDWAYNNHDVRLAYTIEFRDKGRFGFVLPPIQIIPNCEENSAGLIAMVQKAKALGYLQVKY